MKKLFQAIRKNDLDTVRQLIEKKPELTSCTAKQPPKKDDGQSPLQVAFKTGNMEIAEFLMDAGADVNFIEDESCCNEWRAPVIHDAINAAIMKSRWNVNSQIYGGIKVFSNWEEANKAYRALEKLIALGADVNAVDSYGNSCLWRFCLQARQILPSYNHAEQKTSDDRLLTPELYEDLNRIFRLLAQNGMDMDYAAPNFSCKAFEMYKQESLGIFLGN